MRLIIYLKSLTLSNSVDQIFTLHFWHLHNEVSNVSVLIVIVKTMVASIIMIV
jgi:hypothetical protein